MKKGISNSLQNEGIVYLVLVYYDYIEHIIFATSDKKRAEKWRDKYNRIIDNNKDRITQYYDDDNFDKPEPFWYDEMSYGLPIAQIKEVEWR